MYVCIKRAPFHEMTHTNISKVTRMSVERATTYPIIIIIILLMMCTRAKTSQANGVTTARLNFQFLDLGVNLTAATNLLETLRNDRICDTYIIMKAKEDIFTLREKPRGSCAGCCPMKDDDFRLVIYTKDKPNKARVLSHRILSGGGRQQRSLEEGVETVVFVHGFMELSPGTSGMAMKNAYLSRKERYNVILLDWSKMVAGPWYLEAVENVKAAARVLAEFLEEYTRRGEITMSKLHLIGFSLGAHVVGFAGKYLGNGSRVKRITGLDPAFPGFLKDASNRLSKTDAEFVDVIHTDGFRLGYPFPLGDVDFYPNGDENYQFQAGCHLDNLQDEGAVYDIVSCSHLRAWKYYAESVKNPEAFPTEKCVEWNSRTNECVAVKRAFMGFAANPNNTGTFYLKTASKPPYGTNSN